MITETPVTAKMPWAGHVGEVPLHLDYFEGSMFDKVADIAEKYPNNVAFDFMGKSTTYKRAATEIWVNLFSTIARMSVPPVVF